MSATYPGDFRVWGGEYLGKTIAEVYALNPSRVKWYADQRTKLGHAARLFLLAVKHGRVHLDAQGG